MTSVILRAGTQFMMPLLLLFSVFLFVRGHDHPGGGFIGGLIGAAAFALYALAFDVAAARKVLVIDERMVLASGLLLVLVVAAVPMVLGLPMLTHQNFWVELSLPGLGEVALGTPLFFDLGIYLVVIGMTLTIIWTLAEE